MWKSELALYSSGPRSPQVPRDLAAPQPGISWRLVPQLQTGKPYAPGARQRKPPRRPAESSTTLQPDAGASDQLPREGSIPFKPSRRKVGVRIVTFQVILRLLLRATAYHIAQPP